MGKDKVYMKTRGAGDGDLTAGLLGMMDGGDVTEMYGSMGGAEMGKEIYKRGGSMKKKKKKMKKSKRY
tara:strand:- start:195 stop:398 length:204 start_codon:yes stop_codon:yes gene_type:complete